MNGRGLPLPGARRVHGQARAGLEEGRGLWTVSCSHREPAPCRSAWLTLPTPVQRDPAAPGTAALPPARLVWLSVSGEASRVEGIAPQAELLLGAHPGSPPSQRWRLSKLQSQARVLQGLWGLLRVQHSTVLSFSFVLITECCSANLSTWRDRD